MLHIIIVCVAFCMLLQSLFAFAFNSDPITAKSLFWTVGEHVGITDKLATWLYFLWMTIRMTPYSWHSYMHNLLSRTANLERTFISNQSHGANICDWKSQINLPSFLSWHKNDHFVNFYWKATSWPLERMLHFQTGSNMASTKKWFLSEPCW